MCGTILTLKDIQTGQTHINGELTRLLNLGLATRPWSAGVGPIDAIKIG